MSVNALFSRVLQIYEMRKWLEDRISELPGKSKKGLADHLNLPPARITEIINETRSIKGDEVSRVAEYLEWSDTTVLALMNGAKTPPRQAKRTTFVVGYVGAGARIFVYDDHPKGHGLEEVPTPPGYDGDCVAVRVIGDSMFPQIEDGWLLYYAKESEGVPTEMMGKLCIVRLYDDGELLVKKLAKGTSKGLFRLDSLNAPPIEDVRLDWATKVIAIVPK